MLIVVERDFLVFSPSKLNNLGDAFSYYSRTLKSSYDGDIYISEESIEHLGTVQPFAHLFVRITLPSPRGQQFTRS